MASEDGTMGLMTVDDPTMNEETAVGAVCGNGLIEEGEECDGKEWGGVTCESLGYAPGTLVCTNRCTFDVVACGPEGMVLVPGGLFEMGSTVYSDEQPTRQVYVDGFWIDRTEVTVSDYEECEAVGVCSMPGMGGGCNWMVAGREDHPINCVTWYDADAYCSWAGGATKRLPTEAEWEKAARGTDARVYPWGDEPEPSCSDVVMYEGAAGGLGCGMDSTMEVGSNPMGASPYGAHDMAGNVWEWVADWYTSSYDPLELDNPTGPATGTERVLRGGSWNFDNPNYFRAAHRSNYFPGVSVSGLGFRCLRTLSAAQ
ncbi:MAG: formylglycine-generating enzyme family protein [Myxococcota bacterium]